MTFNYLDRKMKLLLLEAFFYLGWGRFLKLLPFSKVAPSLGEQLEETTYYQEQENRELIINISRSIHTMSKYTLWESQCLVKAIAGLKMLQRRGIESTLYLGTAKDDKGKLIAHAWLRSGPYYISGAEQMNKFTVVAMFANKLDVKKLKGESYG